VQDAHDSGPRATLFVVATPIGNRADLSPRARDTLAAVDVVACEDTRHTGRLLAHLGLDCRLLSLHEHNERRRVDEILDRLARGESVALVSDAGTPLLSDPGYLVVRAAAEAGYRVEALPGASAVLAALVSSALPPYPFTFLGFPPPKSGRRRTFYRRWVDADHTLVVFESPHRIAASLDDAVAELGDRPASLCRELTKMHEEVLRGSLTELRSTVAERGSLKGEIVLVIGAAGRKRGD
jgi:16S rRNA (cytidine1402-2'-O)-methyltransferase